MEEKVWWLARRGGASGVNRAFGVDEASLDKVCAPLHAKIGTRWYNWTGSEKG